MYIREYQNPNYKCNDSYFAYNAIDVLFIGGIHGDEINTIMAVGAMAKMPHPHEHIDPHIRKVGFIPCANFEALRLNARGINADTSDLNRGWFKSNYRTWLSEVLSEYDVIIDCHCSENIAPLFYLSTYQPASDVCALIRYFEREKINYALSSNANDTIKITHTMRPGFYHPLIGNYRKQLTLTWEENGMSYQRDSVESTKAMICNMLGHYAYTIYRDALIQELIDTPPVSSFRTLGFMQSTKEGVFICDAHNHQRGRSYTHPLMAIAPGEPMDIGSVREFNLHGKYGDEVSCCSEHLTSNVELRVFEVMNEGRYVTEGMLIASYQPSNADKFPDSDIHNATHTYIPSDCMELGILELSAKINNKKK